MLRRSLGRQRAAPVLLCVLLAICLLYQAYRYPFQINSALTSPTYRSTPALLQYGKWALIAGVLVLLALLVARTLRKATDEWSRFRSVAVALEAALVVLAGVRLLLGAASVEPWVFMLGAVTALVLTLNRSVGPTAGVWLCRLLVGYAIVCIIAEAVQIALFLSVGRLPALAYAGTPSIRFGSVLDDPNGFAVLLAALIPTSWVALSSRPNVRLVVVMALACCLPLTQSWTGVTSGVVALVLTYFLTRDLHRDLPRAIAVVTSTAVVIGVAAFFARSTIAELIRLKRGSVEDHVESFDQIAPGPPVDSATPTPRPTRGAEHHSAATSAAPQPAAPSGHTSHSTWTAGIESSYVNLLVNYGPVLLIAYLALGVIAIVLLLRGWTRLPMALRVGAASYLISFMLASTNLGLDRTFPCNVLYFFFCGLAYASSTRRQRRPEVRDERRRFRIPGRTARAVVPGSS